MLHHMLRAAAQRAFNVLDPYFQYVTMLLHGDGTNGAQNNTFLDSSTNNFTITRNGNTTQGTFSPFGSNWSNYFDGTGDQLTVANNAAFDVGSGSFTVEAWVYLSSTSGSVVNYSNGQTQNSNFAWEIYQTSVTNIQVSVFQSTTQYTASSTSLVANAWNHVAGVRNGNTLTIYVNGVAGGTTASVTGVTVNNPASSTVKVSGYNNSTNNITGYVSNFRVVKGSAVYTANFTPSTTPLTAITNTSLLTCQSNRLTDNSTNNFAITKNGDVSVQRFSPFSPTTAYSTSVIGGSGYFDGTGDYLSAGSSISLSGDFTVEGWYYPTSSSGNGYYLLGLGNDVFSTGATFFITTTGYLRIYTGNANILSGTSGAAQLNTWNHIAFVRSGSTVKAYLNGVQVDSATFTSSLSGTAYINAELNGNPTATVYPGSAGYYSNVRIGTTAVYTTAFTPSTTPLTAITGTQLLTNYTNAGILDNAMMNNLETVGNAQISTSVKKYGTGSMYFDGTGDYLTSPLSSTLAFGSGDFTVECWVYATNTSALRNIIGNYNGTVSTASFVFQMESTGRITGGIYSGSSFVGPTSTASISATTWTHLAVVRNGTSIKLYINGTNDGSTTSSSVANTPSGIFSVGAEQGSYTWNGYIDDLRITKGVARYTANFTPPTAAFPNN